MHSRNIRLYSRNKNTECTKLLGRKVDCNLRFKNYLDGVIKKASNNANALSLTIHEFRKNEN